MVFESDPFWAQDPWVLVKSDAALEILPTSHMPVSERYNALARLVIIIAIGAAVLLKRAWPLMVGGGVLVLDWLLYRRQDKPTKSRSPPPPQACDLFQSIPQSPPLLAPPPPPPVSPWEAFYQGPGENSINGESSRDHGTNPSHDELPAKRTKLPHVTLPLPVAGVQGTVPDLEFSSVAAGFESRHLPQSYAGAPVDNAAFGPATRPIAQPTARPSVLMFQGRQQPLTTANQPSQWPSQWPSQMPKPAPAPEYAQTPMTTPTPTHPQPRLPSQVNPSGAQTCKTWQQMSQAEQLNYLARQRRDAFMDRLFTDTSEGIHNYTFFPGSGYNELEDRERYMDFVAQTMPHQRDPYMTWWAKYFQ